MIQADKNYVYGSTAEKIKYYDVYEENKVLKEKRKQRNNHKLKVKLVLLILLAFAAGLTIMYRYAVITQLSYKVSNAYEQYNNLKNKNTKLKAEIESQIDLQKVKEYAENELGMQKPDKYQIVYVNIPSSDYTEISDIYKKQALGNQNTLTRLWNKVKGVINFLD